MNRTAHACKVAIAAIVPTLLLAACASKPPAPPPATTPAADLPPRAYVEKLSADGLFAFGKASLGDVGGEGRDALDALAAKLAGGHALNAVHVIGHSDRIGNDKANQALSTRRANTVRDYLVSHGVPADIITAVGRGSVEPVVECPSERNQALIDCLAPNRRVEVRVNYAP